jgi:hypothetical protein
MGKLFLLTIASVLLTLSSWAQTSGTTGSLTWSISEDAMFLTVSGTGEMPDYNPISSIKDELPPWYSYRASITNIIVEEGVTSIGDGAFAHFDMKLASVSIPNSVSRIGKWAFLYGSFKSITLPESVKIIDDYAFYSCYALTSLTISGYYLERIGRYAFGCSCCLTSISFSGTVGEIASDAFSDCGEAIYADGEKPEEPVYEVLYNEDKTVLLKYPAKKADTEFTIPGSVIRIEERAFADCKNLASVIIPETVTSMGTGAFAGCSGLTSVIIPGSVSEIEEYTFFGCWRLASVTLSEGVINIGDRAFNSCSSLEFLVLPEGLKRIGIKAFSECVSLTFVVIPESVTTIEYAAFGLCENLVSVTLPAGIIDIHEEAFAGCTNLTIVEVAWDTPLSVSSAVFKDTDTSQSTLYVPFNTKTLYENAEVWNKFGAIIEKAPAAPTAIAGINKAAASIKPVLNGISIETKETSPVSVYNALGQRIYQSIFTGSTEIRLNKGVYIVKIGETNAKVLVK